MSVARDDVRQMFSVLWARRAEQLLQFIQSALLYRPRPADELAPARSTHRSLGFQRTCTTAKNSNRSLFEIWKTFKKN